MEHQLSPEEIVLGVALGYLVSRSLHVATELVERGCPSATAVRIVI